MQITSWKKITSKPSVARYVFATASSQGSTFNSLPGSVKRMGTEIENTNYYGIYITIEKIPTSSFCLLYFKSESRSSSVFSLHIILWGIHSRNSHKRCQQDRSGRIWKPHTCSSEGDLNFGLGLLGLGLISWEKWWSSISSKSRKQLSQHCRGILRQVMADTGWAAF